MAGSAAEATIAGRRCAAVEGFSLHANVRLAANDRDGLEHLARYLARPRSERTGWPSSPAGTSSCISSGCSRTGPDEESERHFADTDGCRCILRDALAR
jgi:hypothetical protein